MGTLSTKEKKKISVEQTSSRARERGDRNKNTELEQNEYD